MPLSIEELLQDERVKYVIGVDECGRGCLFGDVVAGACLLKAGLSGDELNVLVDSKKIKQHTKHVAIADKIKAEMAAAYGIGSASVAEIEQHNILGATMIAMHRAIDRLFEMAREELTPENTVLAIDGCYFKPGYKEFPHTCVVGGDDRVKAISAASLLAKSYRDDYILGLVSDAPEYEKYGLKTNMGYGTAAHRAAIVKHGATDQHRQSFLGKIALAKS
jgi:ribonuclease HII